MAYAPDSARFCAVYSGVPVIPGNGQSRPIRLRRLVLHAKVRREVVEAWPSANDVPMAFVHNAQGTFRTLACQQGAPCIVNGGVYG